MHMPRFQRLSAVHTRTRAVGPGGHIKRFQRFKKQTDRSWLNRGESTIKLPLKRLDIEQVDFHRAEARCE
jgi:hypothetical protein